MYHCHVRFYLIGKDTGLFTQLKEKPPLEAFTHEFWESETPDKSLTAKADVIFADLQEENSLKISETVQTLGMWKKAEAELIVFAKKEQVEVLADVLPKLTDVWTMPMSLTELRFRFLRWQQECKLRKDYWQAGQYLESVINNSPNLVWYKDKNGIHEKVNDSFCETVNKTKSQVQGRGHAYIWDVEQDDPACIESERIVMETKKTCVAEETIETGEGLRTLSTYKSPLYDLDGSVMGTVGIGVDVTKERAYANELLRKNQVLETLFATIDCGVVRHTLDGSRIISINPAALEILGYESEEALIEDGFDLIAPTVIDKEELAEKIRALKEPGDAVSVEYSVRHANGEIRHIMGDIKLMEEEGELFYQRYLLDCTAQRTKEERERKEAEKRQMELIYALCAEYNLVCSFDLRSGKGMVLRIGECKNDLLAPIFSGELLLEECIEEYIEAGVYEEDKEMLRKAASREELEKALSTKLIHSVNYRTTCCGEMRYFQMKVARAGDWEENRGIVFGFRSVDEETRSDRERNALLEDALEQANRASRAKTTFLSNMSHDIRTPMNAIIGFTTLAMAHLDNESQVEEYLRKIKSSGNLLLSLINDVLDMSHIESGRLHMEEEPCSLPDIIRELRNITQSDVHAKQLDFYMDAVDIRHEEICCDRLRLSQILLNLLSNAIKYTGAGGMVSLKVVEKAETLAGYANYEFRVKDTGIGMSEEFLEHIFEPFERERNSTISGIQGTGLGMAITKNIVDMMNGSLEIKSKRGVGTECILSLSLRLHTGETCKAEKEMKKAPHTHMGRILLAEDNALNQEIAVAILEEAGFSVEVAENGQEALEKLRRSEPGYYQVILMDIQMPVMDGYESAREIRKLEKKELANIPILAMTANAFEEDKREARQNGMNGHIAKPIDIEALLQALDEILGKES